MKNLLLLLPLLFLASCASKPSITTYNPHDGTFVRYSAGTVVAARELATVTEITGPGGYHVKHMSEGIDATEVPLAGIQAWLAKFVALFQSDVSKARIVSDERVATGAQGVQMFKEGEKTKRILGTFEPTAKSLP